MATLQSFPATTFPVGPRTIGPNNVPGSVTQYLIVLDIGAFPFTGGVAFTYTCESSDDNGQTWLNEGGGDVYDIAIPAKFGQPANRLPIAVTIHGAGSRKVRFNLNFPKEITFSGTVSAN